MNVLRKSARPDMICDTTFTRTVHAICKPGETGHKLTGQCTHNKQQQLGEHDDITKLHCPF
eukprot:409624-Amphidinium_carterae.1